MKLLIGAALAVTLTTGCSVGEGVGAASGKIFELGCSKDGDYRSSDGTVGTQNTPVDYELRPTFFGGEPIDDLRNYSDTTEIMNNRLTIRLQRSGKQFELNDVLTFDIERSYEVARCVRGRWHKNDNGERTEPDWDTANCYRASDDSPGRVRLQWDSPVHAALTLQATCTAHLVASAVAEDVPVNYNATPRPAVSDGNWLSWVEFQEFGTAAQYGQAPEAREPVSNKFRIELGNRIFARAFKVTLVDEQVVTAARNGLPRPYGVDADGRPGGRIGGTLGGDPTTGRFDFDLERGQGAQFFP